MEETADEKSNVFYDEHKVPKYFSHHYWQAAKIGKTSQQDPTSIS